MRKINILMTTLFPQPYPETAEETCRILMTQWPNVAKDLRNRDGTHHLYPNGGHDIARNQRLLKTIDDIAAGYFMLFHAQVTEKALRNHAKDHNRAGREDVFYKTTLYTRESCKRLVEECGLSVDDACKITGSIIRRCVMTHRSLYHGGVGVGNSALKNIESHCQPSR